jgi:hypothetical protein
MKIAFMLGLALCAVAAPASAAVTVTNYTFTGVVGSIVPIRGTFGLGHDDVLGTNSLQSLNFTLGGTTFTTANASFFDGGTSGIIGGNVNGLNGISCSSGCVDDFALSLNSLPNLSWGTIRYSVSTSPDINSDAVNFALAPTSGVPEPATWAMMLFGFGAIGFWLRRRRTRLAIA